VTTLLAAERPRSPIAVLRREDKELLDQLAPELPTRIRTCAAQLIPYFTQLAKVESCELPNPMDLPTAETYPGRPNEGLLNSCHTGCHQLVAETGLPLDSEE
jgi:hypothetical protein